MIDPKDLGFDEEQIKNDMRELAKFASEKKWTVLYYGLICSLSADLVADSHDETPNEGYVSEEDTKKMTIKDDLN